jgi:hypothetical protein
MKNFFIHSFSVLVSFAAACLLILFWKYLYSLASEDFQLWLPMVFVLISLAVFILGCMFLPDLLKFIFNKEDRLWKKLKKVLPHWAEATIEPGSLRVSWFEGYRDNPEAVNNYRFDFKNNKATFSRTVDCATSISFEGTIKEGVAKLV